jgi:hypothetical protein
MALAVALGALLFVVITHTARARWFVPMRRLAIAVASTLPVFLVLFLPLAFSVHELYPWARAPSDLDATQQAWAAHARPWLNVPFFVARACLYLATWSVLALLLRWASVAGDTRPSQALVRRERTVSAVAIPILAVTLTAASFDWIMSLNSRWSSDMLGLYLFAGAFSGSMGTLAVAAWLAWRARLLPPAVGPDHFHALGRVLFVSVIFWAYIGFCQFLLVWIADMDREASFYADRSDGTWSALAAALVVVHFVVPFLLLLSRALKRAPSGVALVGACVLCGHALDAYWLMVPPLHAGPSVLDAGFMLGIAGVCASVGVSLFGSARPIPIHDPALAESLRYESS